MTGNTRYLTRQGFTQENEWRDTLGGNEPLLMFADHGYCLDAPERIPSGAHSSSPVNEHISRIPFAA